MENFKLKLEHSEWIENGSKSREVILSGEKFKLDKDEDWEFNKLDFLTEIKNKYKNHKYYLSAEQIGAKIKGGFFSKSKWPNWTEANRANFRLEECLFGFGNDNEGMVFDQRRTYSGDYEFDRYWCFFSEAFEYDRVSGRLFTNFNNIRSGFFGENWKEIKEDAEELEIFIDKEISNFWEDCLSTIFSKYAEWENTTIDKIIKSEKSLSKNKSNILKDLDKDGNGEVDVVEGNDFSLLLKKHQKSIIEIDRTYVQQFVKVSSYLKTKKNNVQLIFNSIKDTSNEEELNEYVGILKNEIHSYSLILFNSLNMIVSLLEDDMITFYEIHESFDKLNIFNSNWEHEVSQKLSNIGDGLSSLMYSVEEMGQNIASEIGQLSYVTEESNQMLSAQLQEIDSSLQTNNLLTGIQTYQMYKINKNTKSLRD